MEKTTCYDLFSRLLYAAEEPKRGVASAFPFLLATSDRCDFRFDLSELRRIHGDAINGAGDSKGEALRRFYHGLHTVADVDRSKDELWRHRSAYIGELRRALSIEQKVFYWAWYKPLILMASACKIAAHI